MQTLLTRAGNVELLSNTVDVLGRSLFSMSLDFLLGASDKEFRRWCTAVYVRDYLLENPGSAYSDEFRRFIVGLTGPKQPGEKMSLPELADATGIAEAILKEWLCR